jgi:hypothetical protein
MNKFFKMGVISLSFLIIGGVCIACGVKKNSEKITTEVSEEKETEEVSLFGYRFNIPNEYRFYSYSDNDIVYKNRQKDTTQITIASLAHDDDISSIREEDFKDVAKTLFKESTFEDDEYFETNNYKAYTCSAKEVENGKNINYVVYEHADRSTVFQIFCFMVDANNEEVEQNKEIMKEIYEDFIKLNY